MNKIRIIDLLVKLANGEIDCSTKVFFANRGYYVIDYFYNEFKDIITFDNLIKFLNDEVEIIEEDKKIERVDRELDNDGYLSKKLNEIIDAINELKKGE